MLRQLTTDDMPQLLELAREMHKSGVYSAYPIDEDRIAYILTAIIEEPSALTVGYEVDGTLAGAFAGEVIQDLWVDVMVAVDHAFYVREKYRGSRAGIVLLKEYERWAKDMGADVLRPVVYAGVDNDAVSSILSRMGYETAGAIHKKEVR